MGAAIGLTGALTCNVRFTALYAALLAVSITYHARLLRHDAAWQPTTAAPLVATILAEVIICGLAIHLTILLLRGVPPAITNRRRRRRRITDV